jgi:hypothetical protein
MSLILSGTDGLSDVDGSAATPAIRGTDANTGIFFPAADTIAFSEGGAEAMRITSAGDVGIGTSSPNNSASGRTVLELNNSSDTLLNMSVNGTRYCGIYTTTSEATFGAWANIPTLFATNNTERARITSGGDLLVGATTVPDSPKLGSSTSSASQPSFVSYASSASYTGQILQVRAARNTTNNSFMAINYYNESGADRFTVRDSGNVQNTNNSYGAYSDIKLKENIVDATPKLEDLCKVKVRQYNLKSDPSHKQIGVIAQELEEVFAGIVEETIDQDGEGNYLNTKTKSVKYSVFVPMLIKAMQEQQALITTLTDRITALEAK